jgi:putative transposase
VRLTTAYRTWGFDQCDLHLRNSKQFDWNHKRVYRIYRAFELKLRIRPKQRRMRASPEPLAVPDAIHQTWSMDVMHHQFSHGRTFRLFNVIDDFNREDNTMEAGSVAARQRSSHRTQAPARRPSFVRRSSATKVLRGI